MKKILSFILVIFIFINLSIISFADQFNAEYRTDKKLLYNNKIAVMNLINYDGKDYIPIRVVASLLGLSVEWYGDIHTVYMDETTTPEPLIINNDDTNKFITVKGQQRIYI